ncbi:MAG: copper chaperone PCu(A)C [Anaerolineae bacterium]
MRRIYAFVALLAFLFLSACDGGKDIEVHEPWTRSAAQGENSAVYFVLHNHSSAADELLSAECDCASATEIHQSMEDNSGMMQMLPLESVPLAAHSEVKFEPGGLHIMLVSVRQDLKVGDQITLTLHFKNHPDLKVTVSVQEGPGMRDEHSH